MSIFTPLTDAWFEPLAARQRVIASRFNAQATENDILMEVAVLHLELIRHNTLLETHRLSETQAYEIVQAIEQYAITGQGRQSDYDRAKAEWRYRRADVQDAEEGVGVAVARLAQRLNLDPSVRLQPAGGPVVPLDLVALETPVGGTGPGRTSAAARPGRSAPPDRRGRGPREAGNRPAVASDALAGIQRRCLRRRQQPRPPADGQFRRPHRLRRPALLDVPEHGCRQPLADQAADGRA